MLMHTPSLLLANIAVTTTLGFSLGAVAIRARHDGLLFWAWALAAHTLAFILFSLRGQITDLASIVLANGLLSAAFALFTQGIYEFQQRRCPYWLIWSPVAVIMAAFTLMLGNTQARIVLGAVVLAIQYAFVLQLLLRSRHDTPGRGQYFAAAGFSIALLVLLLRAAGVLMGQVDIVSITDSNLIQAITFLFSTVTIVLISLGLVLMSKERADERNRTLAMQDELTGLSNRRFILETLAQHLAQAQRGGHSLALLLLDLDHFKQINDSFGHLSGDKALRELADCIRARLRAQDSAGRWGGEEFLVILPDTDAQGAYTLAEQLRQTVEQARFRSVDGRAMQLTVSIGLHALDTASKQSCEELLGAADQALYLAKKNGRNRVEHS
jgi:diguanylate cyclase (GGDEF)-like protein